MTWPQGQELADLMMDESQPVNTSVLAAPAAAQCEISSDKCHRCYRIGSPENLYDLVQEMGRTDRDRSLPPGHNRFEMHISWPNVVHLYVRIMKHKTGLECDNQLLRFRESTKLCCNGGGGCVIIDEKLCWNPRPVVSDCASVTNAFSKWVDTI